MKEVVISAGLAILKGNKILLGHPTSGPWFGRHSFPKGQIEVGEDLLSTAIRETFEEVGIKIKPERILGEMQTIPYTDKTGKTYKIVHYFVVRVTEKEFPDILPKEQLQTEEIDWAGFLNYEEARKRIFWRFEPVLELIKPN